VDDIAREDVLALLDAYRRHPDVEYAEVSRVVSICVEPGDPLYAKQWALAKIAAPEAWNTCQGSGEIVVAVIDTGVDYSHRDLQGNLWYNEAELHGVAGVDDDENGYVDDIHGYNFAYNNSDPLDDHGHGTHCAGTIAAVGDNGLDTAGVCWRARIMSLKILGSDGDGTTADAAPAIYYAVANGADVISMSWGGDEESRVLKDALAYARGQGVMVVGAAGNGDTDAPFYPAGYPDVVAVAATDSSDKRWYLSNYGSWVDIAAPGREILSLRAAGTSSGTAEDAYTARSSGTSMAAPHVTGACALLLAANPFLTCDELEQMLLSSGDAIAAGICASNSRVNIAKVLRAAVPARGAVRLDRAAYAEGDEIVVLLADWDLRGAGTQSVLMETGGGDAEETILAETAEAKGVFRAVFPSERGQARPGDGRLQVEHGDRIVVRYLDGGDGSGGVPRWAEALARADYEAPAIVEQTVETRGPTARIEVTTNEPTRAEIRYGRTMGGPLTLRAKDPNLSDRHAIRLAGLTLRAKYYFIIVVTDEAGNERIADNAGQQYSLTAGADFAGFLVPSVYPTIQAAIDDAWDGDTVRVADGTYGGDGNIEIDFGGRAITVRSENGPQSCIIDCRGEGSAFCFQSGEDGQAVLDGFTITNGGDTEYGGAICCVASSPTIRNCILTKNSAELYGGGLCNLYGSHPLVVNCTFQGNTCSLSRSVGRGGGIANRHGSSPTIEDCTFIGNSAAYSGGGLANYDGSSPRVTRCTFRGNSTRHVGGAVGNWDEGHPVFTQCIFSDNSADDDGGGMCNEAGSVVTLANCIFHGNRTEREGGAMTNHEAAVRLTNCTIAGNLADRSCGGIWSSAGGELRLENCILWANEDRDNDADPEPAQVTAAAGDVVVEYCCVQGLSGVLGGMGNIGSDPLFVDPNSEDYHLQSQGWRWDVGQGRWTYDSVTSPCIDAGNPAWPLGAEPRSVPEDPNLLLAANVRIDMGAYGGTAEASMAPPQWALLADVNNDCLVDWRDLARLAEDWAAGQGRCSDLSRDGAVGAPDFVLLAVQWRHEAARVVSVVRPDETTGR
jgi:subtilisin family serine protease